MTADERAILRRVQALTIDEVESGLRRVARLQARTFVLASEADDAGLPKYAERVRDVADELDSLREALQAQRRAVIGATRDS